MLSIKILNSIGEIIVAKRCKQHMVLKGRIAYFLIIATKNTPNHKANIKAMIMLIIIYEIPRVTGQFNVNKLTIA